MKYNKLVRDKILEILSSKGINYDFHYADDEEHWIKVKEKLLEETQEYIRTENPEELSDILEVINTICTLKKIPWDKLEILRKTKAEEKGRFLDKIILDEVKD